MISDEVKRLLSLPPYYIDEYNATPMQNYWCIIEGLLDIFRPETVCEIGSERGITTAHLTEWARAHDKLIHVVDPKMRKDISMSECVTPFVMTSFEYLDGNSADFYIIDGDHNYETVRGELERIERRSEKLPCILMHDVSWMWARRDCYYNPEEIKDKHDYVIDKSLVLEHEGFEEAGFASGHEYAMAVEYGGDRNGVLSALEDFISASRSDWEFFRIPIFYGLAILWSPPMLDESRSGRLNDLLNALRTMMPLLAIAEANRLRLCQGLNEHLFDLDRVAAIVSGNDDTVTSRDINVIAEVSGLASRADQLLSISAELGLELESHGHLSTVREKKIDSLEREVALLREAQVRMNEQNIVLGQKLSRYENFRVVRKLTALLERLFRS